MELFLPGVHISRPKLRSHCVPVAAPSDQKHSLLCQSVPRHKADSQPSHPKLTVWAHKSDISFVSSLVFILYPVQASCLPPCFAGLPKETFHIIKCLIVCLHHLNCLFKSFLIAFIYFLLICDWFTVLVSFVSYINMNEPEVYICLLPLEAPSHIPLSLALPGCYRAPVGVPWSCSKFPLTAYLYMLVCMLPCC